VRTVYSNYLIYVFVLYYRHTEAFSVRQSLRVVHKVIPLVFVIALFSFDSSAQSANPSIYVSPEASLGSLRPADGLEPHLGYGLSVMVPTSDAVMVGIRATFANPSFQFDLVGATGTEQTRMSVFQALFAFHFLRLANIADLSVLGSLGLVTFSAKERFVSAGGFGSIKILARTDQFAIYSLGLRASKELVPRLSAFLSPQMAFLSPVQLSSIGYSIGGGLSVGIF